ncbi:hypothetical protein BS47DRAFT_21728 [Hydnum rufescens UP504]|uniref:RING-type domain-containing protein n=1 Tax=Hydnum rufescens UP504 TaxID=1448309 RepID=A0A9P6B9A9_9AGAM|nr:hypothetical protein BS47DRAFT_21728 [Hydnum rufescens UP504]
MLAPESTSQRSRNGTHHGRSVSPEFLEFQARDASPLGFDSDIALATALSLSMEISSPTSPNSMPPDGIAPSSELGFDSDIALATALSLSLEISGSTSPNSMPPDGIAPSSDTRNGIALAFFAHHDQNRTTHSDSSQVQCPICLEDMTGRATTGAPCGHMLCRTCRENLIDSSDSWPKCHMCRMPYAA